MKDSPIVRALAELQTERANMAARLEKLDTLIALMRDLFHLPATNGHRLATSREALAGSPAKEAP